jgi:hypothetical protein
MRWVTVLAELFGGTVTWMLMVTGRFALSPGLCAFRRIRTPGMTFSNTLASEAAERLTRGAVYPLTITSLSRLCA